MSVLVQSSVPQLHTLVVASGIRASTSFIEFFVLHIRNPNTRRAYGRAVGNFLT